MFFLIKAKYLIYLIYQNNKAFIYLFDMGFYLIPLTILPQSGQASFSKGMYVRVYNSIWELLP